MTTDGAGDLRLDGLEAGTHQVVVLGADNKALQTVTFKVPAYVPGRTPVAHPVVVPDAG